MRYYRELDIDCSRLQQAILDDFNPNTMGLFWNTIEQDHLPLITEIFEPYGLTPVEYALINANPKTYSVHIDISKQDLRINVPILNCEQSSTHFFKPKSDEIVKRKQKEFYDKVANYTIGYYGADVQSIDNKQTAGEDFLGYAHHEVDLIDQVILRKPTILRVREPHAVAVKKNATPRLSLTIEFIEDLMPLLEHGLEPQP